MVPSIFTILRAEANIEPVGPEQKFVKQCAGLSPHGDKEAGDDDVGHGEGSRNFQPKPMSWS
jgi:hypothetical protein